MSTAVAKKPSAVPQGRQAATDEEEVVPYRWIILVGLITAAILEVLDSTIVNVALPQMAGNLGATNQEIGWVATGYILSNVIVLPMTAWLSSRFGRRNYLAGSILLFIAASFLCGTSHSLTELVMWRIVQGAGGAALLSTAQATLREIFPLEQQGTVQAIYILGIIVAPTIGPTLGGWITDNYSWPWIFFVNIPVGLVSTAIVLTFLHDAKYKMHTATIDWTGIGLLAVGLGALQYVLEEGNSEDWFDSPTIVRLTIVSVVALVAMIVWELWPTNKHPVVNFRVLKNRELSAALFLFVALGFGLYGGVFIYPLFAQDILHFTPTVTGLVLLPGGIATGIGAIVCGRLLNGKKQMVSPKILIVIGMALFVYSMWSMGHLTTQSGEPDVRLALILRGLGLGFLFTPINLAALSTLRGAEIPQGTSMLNLMRQLGGSFGIAYLGNFLTTHTAAHRDALVQHLYVTNPALQTRLAETVQGLVAKGYSLAAAKTAALQILDGIVQVQATTMAFNDGFLFIGLVVVMVAPAVLLLRSGQSSVSPADMGH